MMRFDWIKYPTKLRIAWNFINMENRLQIIPVMPLVQMPLKSKQRRVLQEHHRQT